MDAQSPPFPVRSNIIFWKCQHDASESARALAAAPTDTSQKINVQTDATSKANIGPAVPMGDGDAFKCQTAHHQYK